MAHPAEMAQAKPGYKPLGQLNTAADLKKKLGTLKRGRALHEQQWKLNLAFYKGRQYSYYNRAARRIESLPVDDGDKPRHVVRLVSNQIMAYSHSLLAKLLKTKPQMWATPTSGSDEDMKAAQMAEALFEYWWQDMNLDARLEEAVLWSIIAGQGYWKITWDQHAGKQQKFLLRPDGTPITDGPERDVFRAKLQQYGVDPQETVIFMGDICIEAMSPFDVFLDPSAKVFEDCKYAICVHHLDPESIKTQWGADVKPDSIPATPDVTLPFANAEDAGEPTVKCVYIGYFLPSASLPNGRYVVWVENPDQILEDSPWPYPYTELPFVKFPGVRVPGYVYDSSIVEHAIPLQKELNKTISQIVQYKNLTVKPRVWAPAGAMRARLTSEAGVVMEFNPIAGMRPEVEQLPALPPYVFEHLNDIGVRLRDMFSLTDVTEGSLPPNLEAGVAIDLLQEMSTDRLAPTVKLLEKGLERAGNQMLRLAQQYYIEPRLMSIKGTGGALQSKRFKGADLNGAQIRVDVGSGLPRTRAARQARIERLIELQVIRPEQAYKYLELADMAGLAKRYAVDEDKAYREHDKINNGIPLNPASAQQAMMAVNQGQNPETGQPLGPNDDPQEILRRAGLQPSVTDNHEVHMDIHASFMNSIEFEALPTDIQQNYLDHYNATLDIYLSMPIRPEPQAPKVNLQIKSTAGPTVQSKILERAGVQVTPDESAEPPLETWVSDSIDKPDMDQTSNDPLLPQEIQLAEVTQAHAQAAQQQAGMVTAQHKARAAKATADLAEKKLNQSDFRPKPKAKK